MVKYPEIIKRYEDFLMKKHVLTLVLALAVCLQLTLPAAAGYKSYADVDRKSVV